MTQTPLSPLDESHRWTVGDWLREPSTEISWACLYRMLDMLQARADGDNDRFKALCSKGDLPMPTLAKTALEVLGHLLDLFGDDGDHGEGWIAELREEVVINGAERAATTPTGRATIHRLEALEMARCYINSDPDKARELALGSDTPPHAHLVAAVCLLDRMSQNQRAVQAEAIAELRAYFDQINVKGYGKGDDHA